MAKKTATTSGATVRKATLTGGLQVGWETITPRIANAMLKNRLLKVNSKESDKISREFLAGRGAFNGKNAVVFFDDGTLASGQDELLGLVKSRRNKNLFVIRGISRRQTEIDCMSPMEMLNRNGVSYSAAMVAAIKRVLVKKELQGGVIARLGRVKRFSNTELWEEYIANKAVYDTSVRFAYNVYYKSNHCLKPAWVTAYCVYAITELGVTQAYLDTVFDEAINAMTTHLPSRADSLMQKFGDDLRHRQALLTQQEQDGFFTEFWNKCRSGIDTPLTYSPTTHSGLRMI